MVWEIWGLQVEDKRKGRTRGNSTGSGETVAIKGDRDRDGKRERERRGRGRKREREITRIVWVTRNVWLILVCYLGGLVASSATNISGIQWMEFKDEDFRILCCLHCINWRIAMDVSHHRAAWRLSTWFNVSDGLNLYRRRSQNLKTWAVEGSNSLEQIISLDASSYQLAEHLFVLV